LWPRTTSTHRHVDANAEIGHGRGGRRRRCARLASLQLLARGVSLLALASAVRGHDGRRVRRGARWRRGAGLDRVAGHPDGGARRGV
jgi:hypothetical protein